jgi:hypothetical protein
VGVVLLSNQVTGSLLLWTAVLTVLALAVIEFLTAAGRGADTAAVEDADADALEQPVGAGSD